MALQIPQETNWSDAPTIQIPGVSLTTSDQPPQVMYNRHQVQPSMVDPGIPELEDNLEPDQFADLDVLQNLSDDEYYTEIDRAEF